MEITLKLSGERSGGTQRPSLIGPFGAYETLVLFSLAALSYLAWFLRPREMDSDQGGQPGARLGSAG